LTLVPKAGNVCPTSAYKKTQNYMQHRDWNIPSSVFLFRTSSVPLRNCYSLLRPSHTKYISTAIATSYCNILILSVTIFDKENSTQITDEKWIRQANKAADETRRNYTAPQIRKRKQ